MQPGEEIGRLVDELEQMVTDAKKPLMGGTRPTPRSSTPKPSTS